MTVRLLLVDDVLETLESLEIMYSLDNTFQIVGAVVSSDGALEVLHRERVDIVSIDIQLGDSNGLDLCQEIRKTFGHVFVVICSLNVDDEIKRIAEERGANLFIPKPMSTADLRRILMSYQDFQKRTINVDAVIEHLNTL